MKNEKLIKEAEAVNSVIEMLIDMKANEPWISFYIGKLWAYLDLIMNENADEDAVVESGLAAAAGNEEAAKSYELFKAGLYALRPVSREQVEKSWACCEYCEKHKINLVRIEMNYNDSPGSPKRLNPTRVPKFCPICGRPLTAVMA